MRHLLMQQKLFSLKGEFSIMNEHDQIEYTVAGSFWRIPKYFEIYDKQNQIIARLTHRVWQLLPKFSLEINGFPESIEIAKRFSILKPKYDIAGLGITVSGNFWDMNFAIQKDGFEIGRVDQRWLAMSSTYDINIEDEQYETLVIALVVAIDYVKAQERASLVSSAN